MKQYLKKCLPLIGFALLLGVLWGVFQITAEYPLSGEPVSHPVNALNGMELRIEAPSWSVLRGYRIPYTVECSSKERYRMIWDEETSFLHLEKLENDQWYRLKPAEPPSDILGGEHVLGVEPLTFHAAFTQKYDGYGNRLEPGTYRLVLELTADDGSLHYLAAEFSI